MKCPVCGGDARIIASSENESVTVRCSIDGDFEIAKEHLDTLSKLNMGARHLVLNAAILLSAPGRLPHISKPAFERPSDFLSHSSGLCFE